jgi:tetratricopeptide (TPR) repeat protein
MIASPRLAGLDNAMIGQVVATAQALELGRADQALARLQPVLAAHPGHPEVLRLQAGILELRGDHTGAIAASRRALAIRPDDPLYHNTLGTVLGASGDFDGAVASLQRACELQPGLAIAWFNLGVMLTRCVRIDDATAALRRATALAPDHMPARALLADMLRIGGHVEEAVAAYREVLERQPWQGTAWWGLADLRSGAFVAGDIERMRAALRDPHATIDDRVATGFALARALDEEGHLADSLDALRQANAVARQRRRWDPGAFATAIAGIRSAAPARVAAAPSLGSGAVFIAGLPRSGTTLVEQIVASHPRVEGAGELPDLPMVLTEESRRRGRMFPGWVDEAGSSDWQRLGERYLERTARWRTRRPGFTDKLPGNWMYVAAIRAMLPGARIVICRRDPLETCFSCYRQHLVDNEYARTFQDLASYWREFDRTVAHWQSLYPAHLYVHEYEALLEDPEAAIRKLLDACGLPFEEACLRFHENAREVRSPSATQVRRPLTKDTAHARRYGPLLDPLRRVLGLPPFGAGTA